MIRSTGSIDSFILMSNKLFGVENFALCILRACFRLNLLPVPDCVFTLILRCKSVSNIRLGLIYPGLSLTDTDLLIGSLK